MGEGDIGERLSTECRGAGEAMIGLVRSRTGFWNNDCAQPDSIRNPPYNHAINAAGRVSQGLCDDPTKKEEFEGVRATRPLKPVNPLVDKYSIRYRGIIVGE